LFAQFHGGRVREYVETEKQWADRGQLPAGAEFAVAAEEAYARSGGALHRYDRARGWVPIRGGVEQACLSLGPDAPCLFAVGTDRRIARSSVHASSWQGSDRRGFVRAIVTATTLYGLDSRSLVKITPQGYERVWTPPGEQTFLAWRGGFFAAAGNGSILEYSEAQGTWARRPAPDRGDLVAADPVTGALLALDGTGTILRLPRGGTWGPATTLPDREAPAANPGTLLAPAAAGAPPAERKESR